MEFPRLVIVQVGRSILIRDAGHKSEEIIILNKKITLTFPRKMTINCNLKPGFNLFTNPL